MEFEYYGKVTDDGKLQIYHRDRMVEDVKTLSGKDVKLTIQNKVKTRSLNQLRYWHGVVVNIVRDGFRDAGYNMTKQQTHEFLKKEFLYEEWVDEKTGEIFKIPLSLKDGGGVTTSIMKSAIEQIQQWASEHLNVYVPDPNEQLEAFDK